MSLSIGFHLVNYLCVLAYLHDKFTLKLGCLSLSTTSVYLQASVLLCAQDKYTCLWKWMHHICGWWDGLIVQQEKLCFSDTVRGLISDHVGLNVTFFFFISLEDTWLYHWGWAVCASLSHHQENTVVPAWCCWSPQIVYCVKSWPDAICRSFASIRIECVWLLKHTFCVAGGNVSIV